MAYHAKTNRAKKLQCFQTYLNLNVMPCNAKSTLELIMF